MGWTFLGEVEEESLTAAEWERVFLMVNAFGLPHLESQVDYLHCPSCRIAIAAVLVARESTLDEAVSAVGAMPALALVDAFVPAGE